LTPAIFGLALILETWHGAILSALSELSSPNPARKASRLVRRQQLVDATISVLARKGFSALTVADVAKAAGLSVGIINFHFESKEKLLSASLTFLAEEYNRNWKSALSTPRATDAEKLQLMMLSDVDDKVFTNEKLGAWIAFWGEAQGRPTYLEICSSFDAERSHSILQLCEKIIANGGYNLSPPTVARALESLGDGLWLGVTTGNAYMKSSISAEDAGRAIKATLKSFFPKHYQS
jgi:AcrR family transcriptional regulator